MSLHSDFNLRGYSIYMNITDAALIDHIKEHLRDMAFADILRASNGGSKIGAFILGSCFIDYLAGFRYRKTKTTRAKYIKFVGVYMDSFYVPERLYGDLRCKLVHDYSEGGSYAFVDARSDLHKTKLKDGRVVINLEDFITDLLAAMQKYFDELDAGRYVDNAKRRYLDFGLLCVSTDLLEK